MGGQPKTTSAFNGTTDIAFGPNNETNPMERPAG